MSNTEFLILHSHFLLQITWQIDVKKWCACVIKKQPGVGEQPHTTHTSSSGQTFYVDRLIPPAISDMGEQNSLFGTFLLTLRIWRCWNKILLILPELTTVWENFYQDRVYGEEIHGKTYAEIRLRSCSDHCLCRNRTFGLQVQWEHITQHRTAFLSFHIAWPSASTHLHMICKIRRDFCWTSLQKKIPISVERYTGLQRPRACQSGSRVTHFFFLGLQEEWGRMDASLFLICVFVLGGVLPSTKTKSKVWPRGRLHHFLWGICVFFLAYIASCLILHVLASQHRGHFWGTFKSKWSYSGLLPMQGQQGFLTFASWHTHTSRKNILLTWHTQFRADMLLS